MSATIETLIGQHRNELKSFLYRFTTSREDAEDIAQETCIKALDKFNTFRGESTFKTWFFAIGINIARDQFRAQKRWTIDAQDKCKEQVGSMEELARELQEINRSSEYGAYEIYEHIDFCFTCISKTLVLEQQLALLLAEVYDFRVKEIANILNATEGIVRHYLHDGRRTMQVIFENRCALINKKGICHQCAELNGFNTTKIETQRKIARLELVKASKDPDKERLFSMRTSIVRSINPLKAKGLDLHDFLLKHTDRVGSREG